MDGLISGWNTELYLKKLKCHCLCSVQYWYEINICSIAELFMISSQCIRAVGFACQLSNEATSDPQ